MGIPEILLAIGPLAKFGGAAIGQVFHMVKKSRDVKKAANGQADNLSDLDLLKTVVFKKPMNTITAIAMSLGSVATLIATTSEPFSDFLNGFLAGYTSDSLINRPGDV